MPYLQHIASVQNTHLHVWKLCETRNELLSICTGNSINTTIADGIKSDKRAIEVLAEACLIKHIFGSKAQLSHTQEGAPFIHGIETSLSISHSQRFVCIATNSSHRIGIDIESPTDKILRVRNKFLNFDEQAHIAPADMMSSLIAWTSKEAIYKAASIKGIDFKEDIRLHNISQATSDDNIIINQGKLIHASEIKHYDLYSMTIESDMLTLAILRQQQ